jgi:hypothetical protein
MMSGELALWEPSKCQGQAKIMLNWRKSSNLTGGMHGNVTIKGVVYEVRRSNLRPNTTEVLVRITPGISPIASTN